MACDWFDTHRETLDGAVEASESRAYWSAYPEVPSGRIYGETAKDDGLAAWKSRLGTKFDLGQPGRTSWVSDEASPYGIETGVQYPRSDLDTLLPAVTSASESWRHAEIETRVGVCLEILHRINRRSFEMAFAVMHTTGQGFMMAFQAGGPHAQDRGLEAVAYAWREMTRCPQSAMWSKRVSKTETVTLEKTWRVVPRGIAVNVGCSTFPTWNGYPGIFASLATGNAVIVKPHPGAVLPLALTVEIAREVLTEAGFDPNVVTLACDDFEAPIAQDLVVRPEVGIVDFTGGNTFGDWVEANAMQARVYTEKAGVNSIILDGTDDLRGTTGNIAFSLCLFSGQMCTTPQNIFIPADGIDTPDGPMSFDDAAAAIIKAVDWFVSDPARAAEVLGAIQAEATCKRITEARSGCGTVLRDSTAIENERFPGARTATPLVMQVDVADAAAWQREAFGPIIYVVKTESTDESISLAAETAKTKGALTAAVWSRSDDVLNRAAEALTDAGVATSCNLTGQIWVNQSAAFSDFHVSGGNPAGNATLCDAAFVADRFRFVASRVPVPAAVEAAD
ncbi:MAG: phenylacetic acid degradation protein PaaN [Planctomycetes bacterium]|jgi:phenylacetic acid degradation protein paaN|nr:phenylacetic acid degradation protein PaaN [Planctomycetota bacterium]MCP4837960.1 phenylacetic acid degradation protein PaaN [Planctomycetota bacterium]